MKDAIKLNKSELLQISLQNQGNFTMGNLVVLHTLSPAIISSKQILFKTPKN
jgi:hypothetical protein